MSTGARRRGRGRFALAWPGLAWPGTGESSCQSGTVLGAGVGGFLLPAQAPYFVSFHFVSFRDLGMHMDMGMHMGWDRWRSDGVCFTGCPDGILRRVVM